MGITMNNLEVIIGIEVHAVLNTKTKMFSPSLNNHYAAPNTLVNEIDLGLPGTLPQVNKAAIKKGIWLAKALKANINYHEIKFDRKNYYFLDLPKGFQITQQEKPIGENGVIYIDTDNGPKAIHIQRMHLEEDTAKQVNKEDVILLDYNRCGCPLIEIVTGPVINSAKEATEYLKKLIQVLRFNNISDAKLEDGSLRADVNISLRPYGQPDFNNRVEIKNINSISNVAKAINYEIERQTTAMLDGEVIIQETRRFDEATNTTVTMRLKENVSNYRYFREPNITTIVMTDEECNAILKEKNKDIEEIVEELTSFGLKPNNIELLLNDYELYQIFNSLVSKTNLPLQTFNWLTVDLMGLIKKHGHDYSYLTEAKQNNIAKMITLLDDQEINGKQAKVILDQIYLTDKSVADIIKENHFEQIKDVDFLTNLIKKHIAENQDMVSQYEERAQRVEKFLVGLVMRDTNAQANPKITMDLIVKLLTNKQIN